VQFFGQNVLVGAVRWLDVIMGKVKCGK